MRIGQWLLLFVVLLLAIWAATQRREAPQLILLALLTIITVNFSLPAAQGAVSLVPIVSLTSLLLLGVETAVILTAASLVLAELARPLWAGMWEYINLPRPTWRQRLATAVIRLLALGAAALVYPQLAANLPLGSFVAASLINFGLLAAAYGGAYFLLTLLAWLLNRQPASHFFQEHALSVLSAGLLAQPLALYGAASYALGGLPIFVIFSVSVMFVSALVWLSWQRSYVLGQRLAQFAALNSVGASLRETLELPEVIARTYRKMVELIPADRYTIALRNDDGGWQTMPLPPDLAPWAQGMQNTQPDDFLRWVGEHGRLLELDSQNMHFAARHSLQPPQPRPVAWLGVPIQAGERTTGVLALQRLENGQPFSRWSREVLLAVAGQSGAAIQNARLYSETVRLYNLTDAALAQRLQQLQALLDTMVDGVLMVDTVGRIVLVNTMAAQLLAQPAAALYDQPLDVAAAAQPLGYTADELSGLLALLRSGQAPEALRVTYRVSPTATDGSQPGKRRFMERAEAPVLGGPHQVLGFLMLLRDVTEEYELAQQRTDLTRMIVHDLRNPITTFISNMSLVESLLTAEERPADLGIVGDIVQDVKQGSYDMLDMVDSLMDINRMEAGQIVAEVEAVDLHAIAADVIYRLRVLAGHRQIHLALETASALPEAWADADMIRRVLVNLLDNALKFTPRNGRVTCLLETEPPVDAQRAPGVRCRIRDTGPGIPAAYRDQIFERFMRTNEGGAQVRGTGLGLTFCKLAVEAHNGRIWLADTASGGSEFIFTLPGVPLPTDG
jgi:signal transduction histidine kinase